MIGNFRRLLIFQGALCLLVLASGCARYKSKPFKSLPTIKSSEASEVSLGAALLSDDDMFTYFSRRIKSRGYKAVQIIIKNDTNAYYVLNANNIGIQVAERQSVAQMFHLNTGKRVASYALPGIFLSGLLFIPAAVEGSKSSEANRKLDQDFSRRVLDQDTSIIIPPCSQINKVFFVANDDFNNQFDVTLIERNTNTSLTFVVNV